MTEYMYLTDAKDSSSLKRVTGYYDGIELKGGDVHVCRVHYNTRLDRIIIVTNYPDKNKETNIEDDMGFIILCTRACDFLIDYFLEVYMECAEDALGVKLQHRIDLVKNLQNFLLNGNITKAL